MKKKTRLFLFFILSVSVLTFFLYTQFSRAGLFNDKILLGELASPVALKLYFFDVGQGDSILIKTREGRDILIDGGSGGSVLENLDRVMPFWDRHIDIVVLTHPHQDHIGGLFEVLKRYEIGRVLEPSLAKEPDNMAYFNKLAKNVEHSVAGDEIVLEKDLAMYFFYPQNLNLEENDLNDTSLVFKISYKELDFIFTGDATSEVESIILTDNLDSEFLKVGHHGSRYSSSAEFLEAVSPLISIISVGEGNSFGHPTRDTLDRLNTVGSRVLRTDKNGTVEVDVGENGEWRVVCGRGCN